MKPRQNGTPNAGNVMWIALVATGSALFSLALACATPFAAIATIAGTRMSVRLALTLTTVAWLVNQSTGYLLLDYPRTWDSFAWGAAIGLAASLAVGAVMLIRRWIASGLFALAGGFASAFLVYEAVLFFATALLPSGDEAFSFAVIAQILWTNLLALAGLLIFHRLAVAIGLLAADARDRATGYA
ncbi:hypothetical protein [Mesorhizobium sp. 2RAF21]|uniref:hypothetical protein n=1 Tax=Mesorhizobium sp. 2RAF21 TaxID=3232995 RepID=UPI003F977092